MDAGLDIQDFGPEGDHTESLKREITAAYLGWSVGSGSWSISSTGHRLLDLSGLLNLVLDLQYRYELNV